MISGIPIILTAFYLFLIWNGRDSIGFRWCYVDLIISRCTKSVLQHVVLLKIIVGHTTLWDRNCWCTCSSVDGGERVFGVIITLIWMFRSLHGLCGQRITMRSSFLFFVFSRRIYKVFGRLYLLSTKMIVVRWYVSISFCDWFIVGVDGILPVINTRIPEIMDISILQVVS